MLVVYGMLSTAGGKMRTIVQASNGLANAKRLYHHPLPPPFTSPRVDTSKWEYFDLSCVGRDNSDDQELHDAVSAGARIGAIFKEPTITPTEVQQKKLGLKRAYGSPNGAMRGGWNGTN